MTAWLLGSCYLRVANVIRTEISAKTDIQGVQGKGLLDVGKVSIPFPSYCRKLCEIMLFVDSSTNIHPFQSCLVEKAVWLQRSFWSSVLIDI